MKPKQLKFVHFDINPIIKNEVLFNQEHYPVWTRCKAQLIKQYLFYFMMITKHGTYIDGFAGPQKKDKPEAWAAKLAIENEPAWFRRFYLFEIKKAKADCLLQLKESQPDELRNKIKVYCGDFNKLAHDFLKENPIGEHEATFCLLDQRTFECKWSTVKALATHKHGGYKIELFYFLPIYWLDRAITALNDKENKLREWWGRDDWYLLLKRKPWDRAILFKKRFETDFHYNHVKPWPFYSRRGGGSIMYYMIHASDHRQAPIQMMRAYMEVVKPLKEQEQLKLFPGIV